MKFEGISRVALRFPANFKLCLKILVGRVAELADAKDLGSFGEILAGSNPVAPTKDRLPLAGYVENTCRVLEPRTIYLKYAEISVFD
jgi:hypothetical protein